MLSTLEEQLMFVLGKCKQTASYKNIQSLFGGECSFAIVSFIMALWEAMESPFRCLYKFGVFMDLVNRHNNMLGGPESMQTRQFIFSLHRR